MALPLRAYPANGLPDYSVPNNPDPVSLLEILSNENAAVFFLIEIQFQIGTAYYTDCDIDVFYDGNNYLSHPLSIGNPGVSIGMSVDSVSMEFSDVGLQFAAYLLSGDPAGSLCILSWCGVDASTKSVLGVGNMFQGYIDDWDLDGPIASITFVNEFILWRKRTLRKCQASCRWVFKCDECTYSGDEELCNGTYNRCGELSNTDDFGGFRFIPAIQDKQIWWGKVPG